MTLTVVITSVGVNSKQRRQSWLQCTSWCSTGATQHFATNIEFTDRSLESCVSVWNTLWKPVVDSW